MTLRSIALCAFLSSAIACSERSEAAGLTKRRVVDSSAGTVALGIRPAKSYRPAPVSAPGAVDGTITLQGVARDSMVPVGRDSAVCGDSAAVTETRASGSSLANALVWVDSIGVGKPLPQIRRETLTIERCRVEPRVLAVVTHSTINVFSRDPVAHTLRFYREGSDDPIAEIRTVDEGQVVPSEKIASMPGIVEVRCAQHPFVRAYIAVFDHPYFAVTDDQGAFKIDGLPAGTYNIKVWHERLSAPMTQRVVVSASGAARLDAMVALR